MAFNMLFQVRDLTTKEAGIVTGIEEVRERLRYATAEKLVWSGVLRRVTFAKVVQGSNSIEGYNVTLGDAVAAADDDEPIDARGETWAAIIGYRNAMTYVLQLADDPHFQYSEDLIRSLHFMMMRYDLAKHPGRWRPGAIYVRNEATKKIVYQGPDAGKVPGLMKDLVASLNEKSAMPPMVRAAMAHLNLTMIHPFSDGNGRMARVIQSLVLARERILAPEFCSIEEYLGRETQAYYKVLADVGAGAWHPERDAKPWVRFCLKAHYRQATALIQRTEFFRALFDQIEATVKKNGLPERAIIPLVEAAIGLKIRNSRYRTLTETSLNLASRDLKQLVDLKLLKPIGERRGRIYEGAKSLQALCSTIKLPPMQDDPFTPEQTYLPGLGPI